MAVRKIVVCKGEISAALEVATSVAFGFVAFGGVCAVPGIECVVMYPTSFNGGVEVCVGLFCGLLTFESDSVFGIILKSKISYFKTFAHGIVAVSA